MSKLDLEWLAVFDEVYKCGSVSVAADRLGIAQATASIALNKLRAHFSDRLFSRTSRGMQPTPFASDIHPDLADILERLATIRSGRNAFDQRTSSRVFRLCITDISEVVILPQLLESLRRVAPAVRLEVETISAESARRLEEGAVDLAVGFMPQLEGGFFQRTLMTERFVCLAAREHPRIGDRLDVAALAKEGHVVVANSGTGHAIVERVLAQHNIRRNVVLRLPSFLNVARIVAETQTLAIVPRRAAACFAGHLPVKLLEPPVPLPEYYVKLHWHERYHADPGAVWLRRTIANLSREPNSFAAPA